MKLALIVAGMAIFAMALVIQRGRSRRRPRQVLPPGRVVMARGLVAMKRRTL